MNKINVKSVFRLSNCRSISINSEILQYQSFYYKNFNTLTRIELYDRNLEIFINFLISMNYDQVESLFDLNLSTISNEINVYINSKHHKIKNPRDKRIIIVIIEKLYNFTFINKVANSSSRFDFNQNTWYLLSMPEFKDRIFDHNNPLNLIIDFSNIDNLYIRKEVKDYFRYLIVDLKKSFSFIYGNRNRFLKKFVKFSNIYLINRKSICDDSITLINKKWKSYLVETGNTLYTSDYSYSLTNGKTKRVNIKRGVNFVSKLYSFIDNRYLENIEMFTRDYWDIRNIGQHYNPSSRINSISFKDIKQVRIKNNLKELAKYYLSNRASGSAQRIIMNFKRFLRFLNEHDYQIESLTVLKVFHVSKYAEYLTRFSKNEPSKYKELKTLTASLNYINYLGIEKIDQKVLNYKFQARNGNFYNPNIYTANEMKLIFNELEHLPKVYSRIISLLALVGMRPSEACALKRDCLVKNENNGFFLRYLQFKTKKELVVPITDEVACIINSAINDSDILIGSPASYVFSRKNNLPVFTSSVATGIKRQFIKREIKNEFGQTLNIVLSRFRPTYATELSVNGIEPNLIRLMLGQSNISILSHYLAITDEGMTSKLKGLIEYNSNLIKSIGVYDEVIKQEEQLVYPLSNGFCVQNDVDEICKNSNECIYCPMFKSSLEYLSIYKSQLNRINNNLKVAESEGWVRIVEKCNKDIRKLEEIINKLEVNNEV